ncbi:MAG: cytochrome C oxidase subunit IV family protein [Pirellulaceae bacterium]
MESVESNEPIGRRWLSLFVVLVVLTIASFSIANSSLMSNGNTGTLLIMAISGLKALIVVMFFMHLWWEGAWKYVVTVPAVIAAVLLTLALIPDIMRRFESFSNHRSGFSGYKAEKIAGDEQGDGV